MMTFMVAAAGSASTAPANPAREPNTSVEMTTATGERLTAFFMIRGWIT
jgi:hypothetical protein